MKVRRPIDHVIRTHQYGTPFFEHLSKNRGACEFCAKAYKYREPVYKKALPDEVAEVTIYGHARVKYDRLIIFLGFGVSGFASTSQ